MKIKNIINRGGWKMMNRNDRYELVMKEGITLDGKHAGIRGCNNPYATVCQIPIGLSCEYAWETVKHVVENKKGAFKS